MPPADIAGAEHRRRTAQDDYDDEAWAYGYAPHRFRELGPDGRYLHRRWEVPWPPDADKLTDDYHELRGLVLAVNAVGTVDQHNMGVSVGIEILCCRLASIAAGCVCCGNWDELRSADSTSATNGEPISCPAPSPACWTATTSEQCRRIGCDWVSGPGQPPRFVPSNRPDGEPPEPDHPYYYR